MCMYGGWMCMYGLLVCRVQWHVSCLARGAHCFMTTYFNTCHGCHYSRTDTALSLTACHTHNSQAPPRAKSCVS